MADTRTLSDDDIRTEWAQQGTAPAARTDDDDDDTTDTDTSDTSDTGDTGDDA
jgi:hypothetical protein